MQENVSFNGENFTFLFLKIVAKAYPEYAGATVEEVRSLIKSKRIVHFFGDHLPSKKKDGSYPLPSKDEKGNFSPDYEAEPLLKNLKTLILEDREVKGLLVKNLEWARDQKNFPATKYEFPGRRLKELYTGLFGESRLIHKGCKRFYAELFLKYAGYNSVQEIEMDMVKKERSAAPTLPEAQTIVIYQGFYYHFPSHNVETFELEIDYFSGEEFVIKQRNFHRSIGEETYSGKGYLTIDGKIFASLKQPKTERRFEMVISSGRSPHSEEAMLSSITTITSHNQIISVEALLIQEPLLIEDPSLEENIRRYLFLHRYGFRLKESRLNFKSLKANAIDVQTLYPMIGVFRVWRFDNEFNIIQSKLVIDRHYKTMCYTDQYPPNKNHYNTQFCILRVTTPLNRAPRLFITTHPEGRTEIISQLVINVLKEDDKITGGVLLYFNPKEGMAYGRALAMLKEEYTDDEIELKTIPAEEIKATSQGNRDLVLLYEMLEDIQLKMTFPSKEDHNS